MPLKSVLLAAHVRVLALASGQADVLTGLVANSRPEESDGERVLGLFLNTLPLRLAVGDEERWSSLIRRVFQAEREGLPHRRYPAGRLQRQQGAGEPLYETAFNYNHFHVYQGLQGRTDVEVTDPQIFEYTNFALMANFDLDPASGVLGVRLNYGSHQFTAEQAEGWVRLLPAGAGGDGRVGGRPGVGGRPAGRGAGAGGRGVQRHGGDVSGGPHAAGAVRGASRPDAGGGGRGVRGPVVGRTGSWTSGRTSWATGCRRRAWARTRWWACWRSGRWSWWARCTGC